MSYDAMSLISLLHALFYKFHHYPINRHTFSQKRVFSSSKMYFMRVTKICMFDIYKIDVQCRKSNNKHPCEFALTRAVKLLKVLSLRLHNLEYYEKTYHQFYFYQAQLYNKKTGAMG